MAIITTDCDGLSSKKMALITSDCDAMRIHEYQMALITSECVPFTEEWAAVIDGKKAAMTVPAESIVRVQMVGEVSRACSLQSLPLLIVALPLHHPPSRPLPAVAAASPPRPAPPALSPAPLFPPPPAPPLPPLPAPPPSRRPGHHRLFILCLSLRVLCKSCSDINSL